ncbi:signal recognition particle subunit FFH/SRP54 (srp54) [Hydrogenivirga caldilitoris]|uniref:Signal recognition particle protein n=1 Tax=Hydrogenivirga caldilitoris TaxID=246264 RepID=A0A497XR66_9AQUI|nr:signal recognition particle protein [Hydrogenivirga caldilitoris]RLJ71456.1 signal recognition particle subunit FFH/SRP54 (srp54) [Hydrogenivirga caldilitoris]
MLELLTEKFGGTLSKLKGARKLTDKVINDALRDIRLALLEADVDYEVAKSFLKRVRERALSQEVKRNLSPAEQVITIVYEELVNILGKEKEDLKKGTVLFVGLQGTGKTTTIGKIANLLKKKGFKVAVSSTDVRRPAAMLQLERLAERIGVPYYSFEEGLSAVQIAERAVQRAKQDGVDYLLLDTAGRLHVDEELMEELKEIKERVKPSEIIYVADAMQGQTALETAKTFHELLGLTGVVLTKMDGDARGGLALSVRESLGVPIKFIGVGEKVEDIEPFYPDRIAQRILGLGDIQSLVERAQEVIPEDKAQHLSAKVLAGDFNLEDLRDMLRMIQNMGPLDKLLGMIPGIGAQMKNIKVDEKQFKRIEAVINSMTPEERRNPRIINMSRKKRIAAGSGTSISEVNKVLKRYEEMRKMMRKMKGMAGMPLPKFPFKF